VPVPAGEERTKEEKGGDLRGLDSPREEKSLSRGGHEKLTRQWWLGGVIFSRTGCEGARAAGGRGKKPRKSFRNSIFVTISGHDDLSKFFLYPILLPETTMPLESLFAADSPHWGTSAHVFRYARA
jgi:hypothetical protein